MRRCAFMMAAAMTLCGLTARADYLYVRIDLSQVYQNMPAGPGGAAAIPGKGGAGLPRPGVGRPMAPGFPMPIGAGQPVPKSAPGEGPFIYTTIEMKSKPKFEGSKEDGVETGGWLFDHAWGKNGRFVVTPALVPGIVKYINIAKDSPAREFDKAFKKELAATKDPRKFLHAATWAFQHGLSKEFHASMEEFRKLDPKNPVAVNYLRVQTALKKPPTADDPAIKSLIFDLTKTDAVKYHAVNGDAGFYVALTNLQSSFDPDIKRRVNRLQETLESFYYWFALNDQLPQPALPEYRQLLVVTNSVTEFYAKHAQWGSQPFSGDGVTPRRDNFILMSWRPVDDIYRAFDARNQDLWKKLQIKKDWFVSGIIWEKDRIPATSAPDAFNLAFVQTLVLTQKAVEEESELATLSHEGTRQLLFASGLLPRQVHTPEWIAQGLASYFETPKGALHRGVGLPSWSNLVAFKYLRVMKKFDRPVDVLTSVLTDRYYRSAQRYFGDLSDDSEKEKLNDHIQEEMDLANSTAWAFTYFLIERRRQPQLLFRYCQELNSLPRDLDLDERALEACFAKVFDLADPSNPSRIDTAKLTTLADAWFAEMAGVSLENPELQNEYLEVRKLSAKKGAGN